MTKHPDGNEVHDFKVSDYVIIQNRGGSIALYWLDNGLISVGWVSVEEATKNATRSIHNRRIRETFKKPKEDRNYGLPRT